MSDQRDGGTEARLRALDRRAHETRAPADHYAFRVACLSLGQPARAGLEVGDLVEWEEGVFTPCDRCAGTGYRPPSSGDLFCEDCNGNGGEFKTTRKRRGRATHLAPRLVCWPHFEFSREMGEWDFDVADAFAAPGSAALVAPRDPVRAKAPAPLPASRSSKTWRERVAPLVFRVLSLTEAHGAPEAEIKTALSCCFSVFFGPKENHVYKAWRAEVRAQRGLEPHPKKAKAERLAAATRPVPLFETGAGT